MVVPLLVNTVLFALAIWFLGSWFNAVMEQWMPDWLDWLEWLLWPLFGLAFLIVGCFTFTLLANLLAGPFNGRLAARVEERLIGRIATEAEKSSASLVGTIRAAIGGELRKWLYFLGGLLALLVLTFVPVVNLLAPVLWFGFGAWCLALEFADFPLGNRELDFQAQRQLLARHRRSALGFGAAALLAAMIPVVNFALMPAAVAGATLWCAGLAPRGGGDTMHS